jgi:hypothetical protein
LRLLFALLLIAPGCSRPPAESTQPRGLQLEGVTITTWRGAAISASGTAARALITPSGFQAEGVSLRSAAGVELRAPLLDGAIDLSNMSAADGAAVKTSDGCAAQTRGRVAYAAPIVRTEGPLSGGGCGFQLSGSRLTYDVVERRAEVFGPVRTRIEAAP